MRSTVTISTNGFHGEGEVEIYGDWIPWSGIAIGVRLSEEQAGSFDAAVSCPTEGCECGGSSPCLMPAEESDGGPSFPGGPGLYLLGIYAGMPLGIQGIAEKIGAWRSAEGGVGPMKKWIGGRLIGVRAPEDRVQEEGLADSVEPRTLKYDRLTDHEKSRMTWSERIKVMMDDGVTPHDARVKLKGEVMPGRKWDSN